MKLTANGSSKKPSQYECADVMVDVQKRHLAVLLAQNKHNGFDHFDSFKKPRKIAATYHIHGGFTATQIAFIATPNIVQLPAIAKGL